jgi:hypothetical protein
MTQVFATDSIVRRIQLALLAGLSLLCISCSTPVVTNTRSEESTASWAYQQCIASLTRYQNSSACNQVGVSNGSSYADYTYGSQYQYVNDYQQTDSIFRKTSAKVGQAAVLKKASVSAYETYVDALPEQTQRELRSKWLSMAGDATGPQGGLVPESQVQ